MADVMSKVRQEIADYSGKLKIETLAICQQELTKNKKSVTDNDQHFSNLRKIVTDKQQEMRKDFDQYCAKLLQHINDSEAKYSSSLSESKRKIEAKQREIRGIVQKAGAVLTSGSDTDVVKFYREKPTLSEIQLSSIPQYRSPPKSGTDAGKLDSLTQRIERLELIDIACDFHVIPARIQTLTRHAPRNYAISMIATIGEKEVMIGAFISGLVEYTDVTGEKKQAVPLQVNDNLVDLAVLANNDTLVILYKSLGLYLLSRDGRLKKYLDMEPIYKFCITAQQEIVGCDNKFLHIYSSDGKKLVQSIDISYMGTYFFLMQLRENGNGDLCILKCDRAAKLFVVNRAGDLKFTYDGYTAGRRKFEFDPSDIYCDDHCNILIADRNNHTVDMLNSDGHFLGYLLTWRHQITQPTALCIDTAGKLWVGQYDGTLSIFKYSL